MSKPIICDFCKQEITGTNWRNNRRYKLPAFDKCWLATWWYSIRGLDCCEECMNKIKRYVRKGNDE